MRQIRLEEIESNQEKAVEEFKDLKKCSNFISVVKNRANPSNHTSEEKYDHQLNYRED